MRSALKFGAIVAAVGLNVLSAAGQSTLTDVEYALVQDTPLRLDLYKPVTEQKGPLLVYVHGGAWRGGSKKEMPLKELVVDGCPVASVDYRLSTVARFPAQVQDIKAAIRYL